MLNSSFFLKEEPPVHWRERYKARGESLREDGINKMDERKDEEEEAGEKGPH